MWGALPARFRRMRVMVVGCGDVGTRTLLSLCARAQVLVVSRSPERLAQHRSARCRLLKADLDEASSLRRLAGLATRVLYLAPPRGDDARQLRDTRLRQWTMAMRRRTSPEQTVYISTSGVYGDCGGAWVDESRVPQPQTARAQRRVDAERVVRTWDAAAVVLRVPGIYALDRVDGTPARRLLAGTPVLRPQDDVYTNHIHADDLARASVLALRHRVRGLTVNVCDDSAMTMGEYFTQAAACLGLPPPPHITRAQAQVQLSPMQMSFMSESRRLRNQRMKTALGLRLRYPTVREGLSAPFGAEDARDKKAR